MGAERGAVDGSRATPMFVCDATGRPVAANDAALALLGYDAETFLALPAAALAPVVEPGLRRHTRPDGVVVDREVDMEAWHGRPAGRLLLPRAIGAGTVGARPADATLDLPDRRELLGHLCGALRQSEAGGGIVALLFVDVAVPDREPGRGFVAAAIADRLRAAVRRSDMVARLGATGFAVVCEHLQGEIDAAGLAAEVVDDLTVPLVVGGGELVPRVEVGIALAGDPGMSVEELDADFDAATAAAKSHGHARHAAFAAAAHSRSRRQEVMARDLADALDGDKLDVHYQPVVDLRDGAVLGVEALARWLPLDRPPIPPDRFIPAAERSGLINPLGEWVLRTSCRYAADRPGLVVAVNVSPCQVRADFVPTVMGILDGEGLPAARLRLELTESAFLDDPDTATTVLRRLTALGVRLSLDDFGTGYSSLLVLRRLPFDRLKIDRSFVRSVAETRADRDVVAAVLALGRAVGVAATAEGVETDEQAGVLLDLGCKEAQGYLFGRPMPAAECDTWLAAGVSTS
jgi:predicted signal transduction protein with EAL and GGDEF domain